MNNQTFVDYAQRTDALAARSKVRLGDLPTKLEVSRASFFAYRSGKSPITSKAWRQLERAERESGISPPLADQFAAVSAEEKGRLLASASLAEILSLLPVDERARIATNFIDSYIEGTEWRMQGFFLSAQSLARLAAEKEPSRSELLFFAKTVDQSLEPTRQMWQSIVQHLRETLGLDPRSLRERLAGSGPEREKSAPLKKAKPNSSKKGREKKR